MHNELAPLLAALRAFEENPNIDSAEAARRDEISEVDEIANLANECLITDDGRCDWGNIRDLTNLGFNVFGAEHDSFGWLVGGICTKKGVLFYG